MQDKSHRGDVCVWAPKYGFVQCRCFSFNRLGISALEVIASSIPPMIIICSHILLADKPTGSECLPVSGNLKVDKTPI